MSAIRNTRATNGSVLSPVCVGAPLAGARPECEGVVRRAGPTARLSAIALAVVLTSGVVFAQASTAPGSATTATVSTTTAAPATPPAPDLSGLEPVVATQLAEGRQALVDALAAPNPAPAALASNWGSLGILYHAYGLLDAAALCYREAARLQPAELRWPYLLGHTERGRGDLPEARAAFGEALRRRAYAPAAVALAEVALAEGDATTAAAAAERALSLLPGDAAALAAQGQARLSTRDYAGAAASLEAALAALPRADRLHYPLALAYRGLGDAERARQQLALVGKTGPRTPDALLDEVNAARRGELAPLLRGRRAAAAGDWAAAAAEFRRALAANPQSVRARVDLGAALAMSGDAAGARRELEAALEREPGNPTAHFDLGVLLLGQGEPASALAHLEVAVASRPGDAEAQRSLGDALLALGRASDALTPLRAALVIAPADEGARYSEATALVRMGMLAAAFERLDEAQRLMPEQGRLANLFARLLATAPDLTLRNGPRALELATRVWTAQPTADHSRTLALALAEAGRCAEAAALLRSLAAQGPVSEKPALEAMASQWAAGPPCRPRP